MRANNICKWGTMLINYCENSSKKHRLLLNFCKNFIFSIKIFHYILTKINQHIKRIHLQKLIINLNLVYSNSWMNSKFIFSNGIDIWAKLTNSENSLNWYMGKIHIGVFILITIYGIFPPYVVMIDVLIYLKWNSFFILKQFIILNNLKNTFYCVKEIIKR